MRKMSDKVEKIKTRKIKKVFGPLMEKREVSLIFLLIIMVLALMTQTNKFATAANLRVLLNGVSTDMMIAIPMAINLIASNTDFSCYRYSGRSWNGCSAWIC
jgi:ribose/xylose/arabinose/galactoside ABC-type transport system permease subunit